LNNRYHCGSCDNACGAGQVCTNGQCTSECTPPLIKCTFTDGGGGCVDLTKDDNHCGGCATVCTQTDAGDYDAGDPVPDGGDASSNGSWSYGTPKCVNSSCTWICPTQSESVCNGLCFDMKQNHDNCGKCNNACAYDEWCSDGVCCKGGQSNCGGTCSDTTTDPTHCGDCTTKCGGNTPFCSAGQCVAAVVFTDPFTQNQQSTSQCNDWNAFRGQLTGTYSQITIMGALDGGAGMSCSGANANSLCQALHTNTASGPFSCGGHSWSVDNCLGTMEITDMGFCSCGPGYAVRPCSTIAGYWGGANTTLCNAPSQTLTVICQ
jgi:hypothetical protein